MAGYVALAIEGVLAQSGVTLASSQPIKAGTGLYLALRRFYKIALLSHESDLAKIEHWVRVNGLTEYTTALPGAGAGRHPAERADQLKTLRSRGFPLDLYIDSSPAAVAGGMSLGITSLLFASPAFSRPEFRPDARTEVREWGAIEAEMHVQAELRGREPVRTADLED